MFEKEIKFIVDFNLNKIRKSGTFFTLEKLNYSGVHPAIVQYISAELDLMIFEERKKLLQNSMFDYSTPEVTRYFASISQEVKKNKRISYEDIKKLIIQAVSFNVNYVVRPRWSLSKLIFDPSPSRQTEEIRMLFNYTYYYPFLKDIVLSYMSKKKLTSLSMNEFDSLTSRIDNEMLAAGAEKYIDNAMTAISDLFNEGMAVKDKIAPELLLTFLKEKNLTEHTNRLRRALSGDTKQKYVLSEIRSIIFSPEGTEQPVLKPAKPEKVKEIEEEIFPIEPEEEKKPEKENSGVFEKVESRFPIVEEEVEPEDELEDELEAEIDDGFEEPGETDSLSIDSKEPRLLIPEEPEKERDILKAPEREIAEEINLPIIEEEILPADTVEPEKEIDIDLDKETKLTLPDDEIEELYEDDIPVKMTEKNIITDEDEVKFDIESRNQLGELYEFEEEEPEYKGLPEISEKDFNLSEMENELKQIEEELNINSEPPAKEKKMPSTPSSNSGDIFKFLSDKEIDRIIMNIFNDDREDFTNTLEKVTECNSYDESTEILKGVFLTYRINPYSRDAVTLTNAVSRYFDQK